MGYVETLMAENEKIVMKTRQHWMVLAKSIFVNAVFGIAVIIVAIIAGMATQNSLSALIALLFIVPVFAFVRDYLEWWNEEYIVTNRRIIQAEGIINKHVMDSSLEKINDVVLDQSFLGRMFDYGNIGILTASDGGVNNLHHIVSPVKFKTQMLNQKEAMGFDDHAPRAQTDAPRSIPALIAELDELRKQGILTEAEFQEKKSQLLSKM